MGMSQMSQQLLNNLVFSSQPHCTTSMAVESSHCCISLFFFTALPLLLTSTFFSAVSILVAVLVGLAILRGQCHL